MYKLLLITFTFISISLPALSQINNANEGKRFLVTFPQNENSEIYVHVSEVKLGLYISSQYDANIRIENHHNGIVINRAVMANDFIQIDNNELGRREFIEDVSNGVVSNKVIEITSDEDISVSVVNSKRTSSDGYLAYPVEEWGNNYIHNSLYHAVHSGVSRSSGFTIIASENNTKVKVLLKGRGTENGSTKRGNYNIGDTLSIELNSNESFSVKTKSNYSGTYDLSGSLIVSNKPTGVISFHERTKIPQRQTKGGMDNLLEMQQPLSNWRNKFVSVDLGRKYGDFFRVLPLEDETKLTITNYNEDGILQSQTLVNLNTGGDFFEYNNAIIDQVNENAEVGVIGNTIWEADKPILVSQYSYSYSWEVTRNSRDELPYDPFLLNLINEEQFTKNVRFLAPPYGDFDFHKMNLVIKIDSTKQVTEQLESIIFDNQYLYQIYPELLNNRIGTTEYYWLRININSGIHRIESDVRLAAFLYGFGDADSYGMQTALGNLDLVDTLISVDNSIDCDVIDVEYNIKSTFGFNDESLESYIFEIANYDVLFADNIAYDIVINSDGSSLLLDGKVLDPTVPMKLILALESETGKLHYDTLTKENYNSIVLNESIRKVSNPGEIIQIKVNIDENLDTLDYLDDYYFSFNYNPKWFEIMDIEVDGESKISDTIINNYSDITVLSLKEPLLRDYLIDGKQVIIELKTLLNEDTLLTPTVLLSSQYDDKCYFGVKKIEIESQVCAHNYRQVEFLNSDYIELNSSELTALENINISVFDLLGKEVVQDLIITKSKKIDLKNYLNRKGLYIIRINNSNNKPPIKYYHN